MLKNMKLRTKLLTIGCILTIIPLMVVSTIVFFQNKAILKTAKNQTMDSSNKELNQIADLVYTMLESHQEANLKYMRNSLNVAHQILYQKGAISFPEEKATWNAVNQFTNAAATLEIPKMLAGDTWLGQINDPKTEVVVVDQVRNLMDTTCTIFQRMNEAGDMLRVATNVLKLDGNRAIGTFIPAVNPDTKPNPVVSAVLNGQTFVGRAYVVNAWYIAAYEPIYNAEKKVIGMLYVGIPQENVKGLREAILNIKIGKTGYAYVLDSKGRYIISKDGKRDNEDIFNAKDDDGNLFVQEIIKKALPLKPHELSEHQYPWKNTDENKARLKIAKLAYFKDWDWVIGAGSYVDEIFESSTQLQNLEKRGAWFLLATLGISLLAAVVIWLLIAASIVKPILNVMSRLTDGAASISTASSQVSSSSHQLAEGASEQASSLEESSSSLEEMSSMTKQNSENASQADSLMKQANTVVAEANQAMNDLNLSMQDISKASEETSKIIKTIDEIAFQTNLLALNAAVEAARAGEAGAGFAVVADEVRNLAMRAAEAARNTADLIEGTVKKVKDGSDLVGRTNTAFSQVAVSAAKVGELVAEIAAASKEQAQGIEQVSRAVAEMDKIVQRNVSSTEDSANASAQMNNQTELLKNLVGNLVALVGAREKREASNTEAFGSFQASTGEITSGLAKEKQGRSLEKSSVSNRENKGTPEKVIPLEDNF